ncbi:hypothetical protein CR970_03060 [Candidatus Saccharibacteria bacterium]|nr:MAG: hypothetical protein CR970_03060 [Candidatus Saccharibacteria bacterium]
MNASYRSGLFGGKLPLILLLSGLLLSGVILAFTTMEKPPRAAITAKGGAVQQSVVSPEKQSTACTALNVVHAQSILRTTEVQLLTEDALREQTNDMSTSSCTYQSDDEEHRIRLVRRQPLSELGRDYNVSVFSEALPAAAAVLEGYGSQAYWDPDQSALHILQDSVWYTLTLVVDDQPADVQQTKEAADIIRGGL